MPPTPRTWRDYTDAELGPDLAALRSQRADLLKKANKILATSTAQGRDLTPDETRESDALIDEATTIEHRLGKASMGEAQKRSGIERARREHGEPVQRNDPEERAFRPGEYRALTKDESVLDHLIGTGEVAERRGRPLSIGKAIRGIATGQWDGAADERRALSGSNDTAGGYMLNEELSSIWIDKARAACRPRPVHSRHAPSAKEDQPGS